MPGRHLRRAPGWWLRRAALVLAVLGLGAGNGATGWWAVEGRDEDVVAGDGAAALAPSTGTVTVVLAGELAPGMALGGRLEAGGVLGGLGPDLAGADVAVVDLSAAVVDEPPADPGAASWTPASTLDALEAAGVDVVSLANDRALDLGPDGLRQTLAAREGRRLDVIGIGGDEDEAHRPSVRRVGDVTVAVVAATQELIPARIAGDTAGPGRPGVASAKRLDRVVAEVEAAAEAADVVIAYLHWGEPGQACPSAGQLELASALVAAGADVVAGTGSRTVQGAGRLDGAVVAYGLGTLVADGATEAGALALELDRTGVAAWRWLPATVVDGAAEPAPADDEAAQGDLAARRDCARLTP